MGESLDIDQLRAAVRQGQLEWQRHALERMVERGITRAEVREVLLGGERIEDYPGDRPLPSGLFLSWVRGRPVGPENPLQPPTGQLAYVSSRGSPLIMGLQA
jgi:Domain of unknown function (DUF4258)